MIYRYDRQCLLIIFNFLLCYINTVPRGLASKQNIYTRKNQQKNGEDQPETSVREDQLFNIISNSSNLQMYICAV